MGSESNVIQTVSQTYSNKILSSIYGGINTLSTIAFIVSTAAVSQVYDPIVATLYTIGFILFSSLLTLGWTRINYYLKYARRSSSNEKLEIEGEKERITADKVPIRIGGKAEKNIADLEERTIQPGETVTLKRESESKIKVTGAINDTIETEDAHVILVNMYPADLMLAELIKYISVPELVESEVSDENMEESKKDSAVSPVVGVLMMVAMTVILVVLIIGIMYGMIFYVANLFNLKPYLHILLGILVFDFVLNWVVYGFSSIKDSINQVNVKIKEYKDRKYVHVDRHFTQRLLYNKSEYYVVPNDAEPHGWVSPTGVEATTSCDLFLENENIEGIEDHDELADNVVYPVETFGKANASYDTLDSVSIYDKNFNEVMNVDIPQDEQQTELTE